ncbi:TonB-dependent receptor [Hymenobacter psychrophilus]|uniref:Vitamin B12 transporter n=1 Tax=Hymenobacter psychrophilus TaxID=651662 RepID=A0A1H3L363_9BACT|nr:TonB-dependent receptor [Hymenobacter psychrophilus]SDY58872.1 vitamin B12 transporter [Hymenobacter psychrophilus]
MQPNTFRSSNATPRFGAALALGTFLVAGPFRPAQAQAPADTLRRQSLSEVVVTATRTATERGKIPQQLQVISRQDIQQTPTQDFTDVLKKNASVDVIQYPGLLAGVGIRGFRPQTGGLNQRALLLVDGRPAGTSNLATLDLNSVEQVEVLKGPASALYGSQAMGGVVNVVTRKSRGAVRSSLFTEYGSFQTFRVGGATGGNITQKLDFDLSFGLFDRAQDYKLGRGGVFRGWLNGDNATKTYANDSSAQTDDRRADGQRRQFTKLGYYSGALRLGYQLSSRWRVDVRGERFVARNVESPNDVFYGNLGPSSKHIERQNIDLSATGTYARHELFVRGYASQETNDNNTLAGAKNVPIVPYRSFQSQYVWRGLQVKDVLTLGRQRLTVGLDRNEATSNSQRFNATSVAIAPFNPNYELNTTGLYAQAQLSLLAEKLILMPGARYDFITYNVKQTDLLTTFTPGKTTNPFFSPSLGAQYELRPGLRAHGTVGRAYVTPDAYNVAGYSQTAPNAARQVSITTGNAGLKNESSVTWDAGLRFDRPTSGFSASAAYFATQVKNRITTRTVNPVGETTTEGYLVRARTTYVNANDSRIRGLESEAGYDFGVAADNRYSLRVFAGGTRIFTAEDVTNATDGTQTTRVIFNVARLSGNYGVAFDNNRGLRARLGGHYVGRRRDTDFTDVQSPQIEYPRYMTLDFSAGYTLAQKHTLAVLVNNLTDENYYEKRGYNLPGRTITGRYTLTF